MNLEIYNNVREVPQEAMKKIGGGRLKGMTDINPMWRIKILTEQFGAIGQGWKYEIVKREIIDGANEEKAAFVDINLYYKIKDVWSEPIPGTGGSMFVTKESKGLYTSDECFKMALTDAISVACKGLGVGADIYWDKDRTKYSAKGKEATKPPVKPAPKSLTSAEIRAKLKGQSKEHLDKIFAKYNVFVVEEFKDCQLVEIAKIMKWL